MSFGTGQVSVGQPKKYIAYAGLIKSETEAVGGKFKAFNQRALVMAWKNLGSMQDVENGACRALSAAYLCRQYWSCSVKGADGALNEADALGLLKGDPELICAGGRFFKVFKEGRLSDDERTSSKVQREQPENFPSKVVQTRGRLVNRDNGRLTLPSFEGKHVVPGFGGAKSSETWRMRRIEHVAEVHEDTRYSTKHGGYFINEGDRYQTEMADTMELFSTTLQSSRSGEIRLGGPYNDWIWSMGEARGFFMCWVKAMRGKAGHALALAMRTEGSWNGYKVKFFDPNFGESKFKTAEDFKTFLGKIAVRFSDEYYQSYMDYLEFSG